MPSSCCVRQLIFMFNHFLEFNIRQGVPQATRLPPARILKKSVTHGHEIYSPGFVFYHWETAVLIFNWRSESNAIVQE